MALPAILLPLFCALPWLGARRADLGPVDLPEGPAVVVAEGRQQRGAAPSAGTGIQQAAVQRQLTRAQIDAAIGRYAVEDLTVLSSSARRSIEPQATTALRPGEILAVRTGGPPTESVTADNDVKYTLPLRVFAAGAGDQTLDLGVVLIVAGGGIDFRPDLNRYVGTVLIGLEDSTGSVRNQPLPTGVALQLVTDPGGVQPSQVRLDHVGQPFTEVEASASAVERGLPVLLRVIPDFTDPEELSIEVRRPRIRLQASPARIQGLGLGKSRITVTTARASAASIRSVTLHEDRGILEPPTVSIGSDGVGTTDLRSSGLGLARIGLVSQDLDGEPVEVVFTWPVAFLLSALAGGVIGGFVARYRASDPRLPMDAALRGALVGVVVTVAYAATVNLVGGLDVGTYFNEAAVFTLAAVGAIFGIFKPGTSGNGGG